MLQNLLGRKPTNGKQTKDSKKIAKHENLKKAAQILAAR